MTTDEKMAEAVKNKLCELAIFIMGNWNAADEFTNLHLTRKEVVTILDSLYEIYDSMTDDERETVDGIIKRVSEPLGMVNTNR